MSGRGSFSCKTQYKTFIRSITGMNPTIHTSRASLSFSAISPFRYFKHKNKNYRDNPPKSRISTILLSCAICHSTANKQTNNKWVRGGTNKQVIRRSLLKCIQFRLSSLTLFYFIFILFYYFPCPR